MQQQALPAQKQLEAYNNRDLEAFLACYSEDCVVEDAEGKVLMANKEEMRTRYKELFEQSPDLHCRLVSRIVVGDYVLDEENVTGVAWKYRNEPCGCGV
ncbi:MAG: nuclear transport factor 2 family protein [Bacillaceae bacterium]|nr:nuclear transport factor 2 family protein [Bacillaceae bacterium]